VPERMAGWYALLSRLNSKSTVSVGAAVISAPLAALIIVRSLPGFIAFPHRLANLALDRGSVGLLWGVIIFGFLALVATFLYKLFSQERTHRFALEAIRVENENLRQNLRELALLLHHTQLEIGTEATSQLLRLAEKIVKTA
jgi:hypothetical protein